MLYLGVSETHEAQANIIRALTRKFPLDPALSVEEISRRCPLNYTGADFYALCSDALLNAMSRKAQEVDEKIGKLISLLESMHTSISVELLKKAGYEKHRHLTPQLYLSEMAPPSMLDFTVDLRDFEKALNNLVPSVSQAEMNHYNSIRKKFGRGQNI
jgi:peroxin-6